MIVGSYPNRTPGGRNEAKEGGGKAREQEAAELKKKGEGQNTKSNASCLGCQLWV